MSAYIASIGTAVPPFHIDQCKVPESLDKLMPLNENQKKTVDKIYQSTGLDCRYSVIPDYSDPTTPEKRLFTEDVGYSPDTDKRMGLYKKEAPVLGIRAIESCLSKTSDISKNQITHLITVSCTGMYAPGLDIEIAQTLGLNADIERTAIIFMGCYGAFNGLKVAHSICKANPEAKVLLVCVELCTLHFQKKYTLDNIVANALFADGAACALIEGRPTQEKCLSLERFLCGLVPHSNKEMAWHVGNHGFDIVLSSYVPALIETGIKKFAEKLLGSFHLSLETMTHFAIHPGGKKILSACESALSLPREKNRHAYHVLKNYGNMSSATILFVLNEILMETAPVQHDKPIFSCAFGPGLTVESALLKIHHA